MHSSLPAPSQELIFLDPDDDLATVRAKLESTAADEVYLVIPRNASILRTPLEFRILGRLAGELSSETIIVSSDGHRRYLAGREGFRTKGSLRQLRHLMAPDPRPGPLGPVLDWIPAPSMRIGALSIALVVAILALAYLVLPQMTITITPKADALTQDVEVTVDPGALRPDPSRRIIPGRTLEHRLDAQGSVPTSGRTQIGRSRAIGEVLIFNQRREDVEVPKGTVLLTESGMRFTTTADVAVPASSRTGAHAEVMAVEPGSKGNVQPRTITRFEDAQFAGLEVVNLRATSGGTDREGLSVTQEDIAKLREQLMKQAREEATLALRGASGGLVVSEGGVRLSVLDERFDQEVGMAAERLTGRITVMATAIGFKRDDLERLVGQKMTAELDPQFRLAGGAPKLGEIRVQSAEADKLELRVRSEAVVISHVDPRGLENALRGRSIDEARSILARVQGLSVPPRLELWPEWSPRAFRVAVEVAAPR